MRPTCFTTLILLGLSSGCVAIGSSDPVDGSTGTPIPDTARGRAPRRMRVDQFHAALQDATGFVWQAPLTVLDPTAPVGYRDDPQADMLQQLSVTLGRPDYALGTTEDIDPSVIFSKVAGDAVRSACRRGVDADVMRSTSERRLLRYVAPTDTATSARSAVRQNLAYLVLRFWGRVLDPNDREIDPLFDLFVHASTSNPTTGWRVVCIGLATDPQFLTY
jgi:hypothetical protein